METIQCSVYVCVLANDLVWQMMSQEQTQAAQQSVHTNKQTNRGEGQIGRREQWQQRWRWSIIVKHRSAKVYAALIGSAVLRVWPSTCRHERANAGFFAGALCASSVAAVPRPYACISERESVHVWDVTQTRAAQHSRLFKGSFILLQLVQLLKTDKQDLELRTAKNRPPTPLLKPLWPGPTLHCDWEKRQTKIPQTGKKVHEEV